MSGRSVQEQRTEASRRLLIDAALRIIGTGGLRALTAARIEEVSGASRGLVNYHFGSKDGLLAAVIRQAQHFVATIPDLAVAAGATGAEGLLQIAHGYLAQMARDPGEHRAILLLITESIVAQPTLREPIRALNAGLRDSVRAQFARGVTDGSLRPDIDPAAEAAVIAGTLRGIALQWHADPDSLDLALAEGRVIALIRRAYLTRPGDDPA